MRNAGLRHNGRRDPPTGSDPELNGYHSHVRSDVFHLIPRGGRLIDFGGGDGTTAAALKAAGHAERIGVVDLVAPDPANTLDFAFQGDIADDGFVSRIAEAEGPFDTILALDVLEHFVDPWAVVARLHGLLKPGGALVASLPNVRFYRVSLPLLTRGRWDYADAGVLDRTHLRFFVRDTAIALMTSSGLALDRYEPRPPARARDRLINRLLLGLPSDLFAMQHYLRVKRTD